MSMPAWKGLFDWSMQHQSQEGGVPKQVTEKDRKWFQEAMAQYTVDYVQRMKQIKATLDESNDSADVVQQKQDVLEELLEIVDNIDNARDLHTIGGLPTLLSLLQAPQASIRWRAAEVVATCVQNNPPVQQWFMEGGAMPKLLHLLHDEDASCRIKALLALSCLIRLNPLALEVFRQKRGVIQLVDAARDSEVKVQRKALHLLRHVIHAHPPDAAAACQLGAPQQAATCLASSDDDTWQAAVLLIQEMTQNAEALEHLKQDTQLQNRLQSLETRLQGLTGEDNEALEEESRQCTELTNNLYRQPHQSVPASMAEPSQDGEPDQASSGGQIHPFAAVTSSLNQETPLLLGPPS
ncbi:hypothetical protein ABBQ32_010316 [Trebouxia sp. C0010 RCD-2024]